jgi:hypothetical protein
MKSNRIVALAAAITAATLSRAHAQNPAPIEFGFLWHMHQPIYYPGENVVQTQQNNRYSFSLYDVHNQRVGPYTTWPRNAVGAGSFLPNLGTQVSFSGSLVENINNLRNAGVGGGMWNNWNSAYTQAKTWNTQRGNTRMDMIGFNYHHGLGPLLDTRDLRMQIRMHKHVTQQTFGGAYSRGYFPAETAFATRMIPALLAEGMEWTLVDNIHIDRAAKTYPHTNASGLFAPNKADQINPAPAAWVQLNNLWAPSKVGAPDSYRPAYVQHVDPSTGQVQRIIAVPAARYEGNEDGRGGYGAFLYSQVMDQYRQYNTDPARPMFVMLHHDGDNYGGGSESYYHGNFQNMINWVRNDPRYNATTVQDYLSRFPVPQNAVIHVEPGSWAGADNGDPEFKKWLGDPNAAGWSPDRNSWAVLTAAKNRVYTAEDLTGPANVANVINNTGSHAERAWHYLTQAQASDHWYWDGTEIWDSNVTRGSNLATARADQALTPAAIANETTPPSVFHPQRDIYNPGGYEFGANPEPADFKVWTYAYDVSGLASVTLKYRVDGDGENPLSSTQNETYAGGSEVGQWISLPMSVQQEGARPANILAPTYRAMQYAATIAGQRNVLLDYFVEAIDNRGNIARTDIQHVWVGGQTTLPGDFSMDGVLDADATEIASNGGMKLHYARKGAKLYVATNDAGEGNDHFIYLARTPGAMRPANWAKAGQIAQWDAYLADENSNDWEGWFDTTGAAQAATGPNGGVLEGTLDLIGEFGFIPSELWFAVGVYQDWDGGALLWQHQVPPSVDSDGNIQPAEFFRLFLGEGWSFNGSGTWQNTTNWFDGAIPNAPNAHARFLTPITSPATVTAVAPVTVGQITFDNAHAYTLAGSTITLQSTSGPARINLSSGSHLITAPVLTNSPTEIRTLQPSSTLTISDLRPTPHGITKSGPGTFRTPRIEAGPLLVDAGTLRLTGMGTTSRVTALQIGYSGGQPVGRLDLDDNRLIVDYTGVSPLPSLSHALFSGRNGGTWDGNGISSFAASNHLAGITAIGAIEAADYLAATGSTTFGGFSLDATAVLLKYTYNGDTDLNGVVDFDDYARIDAAYLSGTGDTWFEGDSNYSGTVDFDDYALMDSAFLLQGGALDRTMNFIPEPVGAALPAALCVLLARRRGAVA